MISAERDQQVGVIRTPYQVMLFDERPVRDY
jgi:hypothetical protein